MAVQAHYLKQLKDFAKPEGLPIIFAGDLFDRWNVQPELINFALEHLPDDMISIPGQHDLPNHRLDQMHRSGYGVLAECGKIKDISGGSDPAGVHCPGGGFLAYGFAWGEEIRPPMSPLVGLAVIHRYCWAPGKSYPGAPKESAYSAFKKKLKGYHAAVFGDNHIGFQAVSGKCNIINTGTFIRRKSDERGYRPRFGVLYSDGSIKSKFLDTSIDRFFEKDDEREEVPVNIVDFVKGLQALGEEGLNFKETVRRHIDKEDLDERTEEIILKSLEDE